jgi:hypothetical protein
MTALICGIVAALGVGGFLVFIATRLALDLGMFRKNSNEIKEALGWCVVWFSLAMASVRRCLPKQLLLSYYAHQIIKTGED